MVSKRIFTKKDLEYLPTLPSGCEWILFACAPCINAVDDPNLAWVTNSSYGEDKYYWDYYPHDLNLRIRHREHVSFDTAINAIVNLVWMNYKPRT